MTISEVKNILNARFLCLEEKGENEIHTACGADMMSDVLAFVKDQALLITGLTNPQVVRTAEMMDIVCICFVRGKEPTEDVIELAKEKGIVLLATDERMFPACGKLYEKGLSGGQLAL